LQFLIGPAEILRGLEVDIADVAVGGKQKDPIDGMVTDELEFHEVSRHRAVTFMEKPEMAEARGQ
jgi:hypothetical protein